LIERFLQALERELSDLSEPREVDTLFLGGGTPTHLRGELLRQLLQLVRRWHPLAESGEFSVEANPCDIDEDTIESLAKYGVTRLSLGSQSFNSEKLRLLERDHQAGQIADAVKLARQRKLNVSLDLIFGTPGEALRDWQSDLEAAIELQPDHLSTYGLTFERGTSFWNRLQSGQLLQADEELERQMYAAAIDRIVTAGFEHYEVSNFAQPGNRCRHNEVYWSGGEYFAAGPGAARHLGGVRETNIRSVTAWIQKLLSGKSPIAERERLSPSDRAGELFVFGLRRMQGVEHAWFAERTGYEVKELFAAPLSHFVQAGLLADDGTTIRLTREGLFISDSLWPHFLQE
jgi:oxygen-independent coproporphyrinogen-3 oxidase